MLKIAIVGYGNLGKSLESEAEKCGMKVVAVYSRRNLQHMLYRPMRDVGKARDFDVAMLALGSFADILHYADALAPLDTVDSFDTHAKIAEYKAHLNEIKRDSLAVISTGWDPGLLSLVRAISGVGDARTATLWGEGVSQGHSNALRAIPGVLDAVQFTVPKQNACEQAQKGADSQTLHRRICYVACVEGDRERVEREIKGMPNYFEGYETVVHFVSQQEVRKQKRRTNHHGRVIGWGEGFATDFSVTMDSNTDYTAKIMLAYARALPQLKADGYRGALDVLDVPLKYLAGREII